MRKHKWQTTFLALLIIALLVCISGLWFLFNVRSDSRLSVTYIEAVPLQENWKLRFGITNVGNTAIFTSRLATIETVDPKSTFSVGGIGSKFQLNPGEGQIIEAVLSETNIQMLQSKWRYKCLYARDGVRARIFRWQFRADGPKKSAYWLIPKKLRGMPLNVEGSSDWIEPIRLTGANAHEEVKK